MKRIVLLVTLLLTVGLQAFAQTHNVTGKILDENGQGYPGAGITVQGTQVGTVSDVNGDFSLEVPDGKKTFIIQAVGYGSQTVTHEEGSQMVVKLKPMAKTLEGAVVTALGVKREKRELGYSSTTVSNEDLTAGQNTSALSGLAGKVAGANITSTTGGPGGDTRIVLRGEKSILKDNNALIVIDGVIMNNYDRTQDASGLAQIDFGNAANDLDPDEIESVTVLEGPAAAALYGAAASNGAVMITTKAAKRNNGGKYDKMSVTYKATYTQSDVLKFPQYQTEFGQGAPGIVDDRPDNFSWGPKFTGALTPWGQIIDGKQQVKPYSAISSNPEKQYFQRGKNLSNFASIGGGTETSSYYLSLNATNSNGVVPNTFNNRYSIRFNGATELGNNFYSDVQVNYTNANARAVAQGQSTGGVMQSLLQIPVDIPIAPLKNLNNKFNSMDYIDTAGVHRFGYFGDFAANPYWQAANYVNENKVDKVMGNLKVGYKKGDWNIYDRVGVDATADRSYYSTPFIFSQSADQSTSTYYNQYNYNNNGGYQQTLYNGLRFYNDLIGTYTHQLSSNFGMTALVGNNTTLREDKTLTTTIDPIISGLIIPGFYNFTSASGPLTAKNTTLESRTQAIYASVKFNFQKELFLELTGRNEWSSTLDHSVNPYFYPGANASWVFTERMKGTVKDKVLNYGKIRMGLAGGSSDAIPYANNSAGYSQAPIQSGFGKIQGPFNSVPYLTIGSSFGDKKLKPELTSEYEVGTDLSFFKDRISLSFTYYDDRTHNLITAVPVPKSTGYALNTINVGDITNKGEELSIKGTPISTKYGLKWDLFGTYTHNVSKVVSLIGGVSQVTIGGFSGMGIVAAVGQPYGAFYGSDIQYEQDPTTKKWHAIVDAATGLPLYTAKPQIRGTFQPKFQASWGTDLSYKGLKLHFLFTTKQGGLFYSQNKNLMDFVGSSIETTTNHRNPYVWANSVNNIAPTGAAPIYVTNTTKFVPYDYWVNEVGQNNIPAQNLVNATYIRLQEAALSYKIPRKYYEKSPFGALEAGIFGNNLLLWTAKSNKYDDPEEGTSGATANGQGFNFSANPSLRNYGAFIRVTF